MELDVGVNTLANLGQPRHSRMALYKQQWVMAPAEGYAHVPASSIMMRVQGTLHRNCFGLPSDSLYISRIGKLRHQKK